MLKPVAEHAEKEGVLLLVEPEPGLLSRRPTSSWSSCSTSTRRRVGLNFDIGHCLLRRATTRPRRSRALAKYIRHFHLEDIAATRVHHHLIPGEGAIDFAATLQAIRGDRLRGWVTIELYPYVDDPDAAARTALERVTEILATPMSRLRAYAQLVRLPNVFTAMADIGLGALALAGRSPALVGCRSSCCWPRRRACTAPAWSGTTSSTSSRTGASGPFRPMPSGRVTPRRPALLGARLLAAGVGFAVLAGWSPTAGVRLAPAGRRRPAGGRPSCSTTAG